MAAPDVTKVQGIAGTVNFDGSDMGILTSIRLIPIQRAFAVTAEEYGGKIVEEYDLGRDWILAGIARGRDANLFDAIFSGSSGGSLDETLTKSIAAPLSARSGRLIFTPLDAAHVGFTLWKAMPRVAESARIPFSVHDRVGFAVIFRAIPDATGRDISW